MEENTGETLIQKVSRLKKIYSEIDKISEIFGLFENSFKSKERRGKDLLDKVSITLEQLKNNINLFNKLHEEILNLSDIENEENSSIDDQIEEIMDMSQYVLNLMSYIRQKKEEFSLA